MRIWLNKISPPALYSWACQRESGPDNVGVPSSSSSPAVSSRVWTRTDKNTDPSPGPNSPGPSSPVDCGLEEKKISLSAQTQMFGFADAELTVENLAIVLVILAVVGPSEAGAQTKVCQLDVPVCIWARWTRYRDQHYLMLSFAPTVIVESYLSGCCRAWCLCGWIPSCGRCRRHKPAQRCRTWWMGGTFSHQTTFQKEKCLAETSRSWMLQNSTHCASSSWKMPNLMRRDIKSPPGI